MDGVDRRLWGAADAGRTKGVREGKCIGTENVSVAEDAFAGRRTTRCSCEQPPPSLLPAFYSLFLFFTFSPFFFSSSVLVWRPTRFFFPRLTTPGAASRRTEKLNEIVICGWE